MTFYTVHLHVHVSITMKPLFCVLFLHDFLSEENNALSCTCVLYMYLLLVILLLGCPCYKEYQ